MVKLEHEGWEPHPTIETVPAMMVNKTLFGASPPVNNFVSHMKILHGGRTQWVREPGCEPGC